MTDWSGQNEQVNRETQPATRGVLAAGPHPERKLGDPTIASPAPQVRAAMSSVNPDGRLRSLQDPLRRSGGFARTSLPPKSHVAKPSRVSAPKTPHSGLRSSILPYAHEPEREESLQPKLARSATGRRFSGSFPAGESRTGLRPGWAMTQSLPRAREVALRAACKSFRGKRRGHKMGAAIRDRCPGKM